MDNLRRRISPEQLKKILEEHRKWVESDGVYGKKANLFGANLQNTYLHGAILREVDLSGTNLFGANLQEANLIYANLQGAHLHEANLLGANLNGADLKGTHFGNDIFVWDFEIKGLTVSKVTGAKNWDLAYYPADFLKVLGLQPDHNKTLPNKLAELEKKEKEAATKKK